MRWLKNEFIIIPILFIWAIVVGVNYHQQHLQYYQLLKPFSDNIITSLLLCVILLVSFTIGRRFLGLFRIEVLSLMETSLFSMGIGLGVLMYSTFLLGTIGLLYPWAGYGLLIILGIVSIIGLKLRLPAKKKPNQKSIQKQKENSFTWVEKIICGSIILVLVACSVSCLSPNIAWDAAVYHLNAPKMYIQAHQLIYIPLNLCSNMPLNVEMLYTLAMLIQGSQLANLIHLSFCILILLSIYAFSVRYFNKQVGLLAAAIFLTNPVTIFEASIAYIDLALTFYYLLALYGFFLWRDSKKQGFIPLIAIFSGIAIGMKYTGVYGGFIIGIGIILQMWLIDKSNFSKIFTNALLFAIVCLLPFVPWLIKSYIFTGNPVYPMLYDIFGGKDWNKEIGDAFGQLMHSLGMGHKWLDYLKLPWNITIYGNYGPKTFDNAITPLGLIFIPLLLFLKGVHKVIPYLLAYLLTFLILWAVSSQQARFLLPILPLVSLISGYAIWELFEQGKWIKTLYYPVLIGVFITFCYTTVPNLLNTCYDLPVVVGLESKDVYLTRTFQPYATFKYINEKLPQSVNILFLWENRGYYCEKKYMADSAFEASYMLQMIRQCGNVEKLHAKLKELKITHILLNKNLASIFCDQKGKELPIIEEFLGKYTKQVYSENNVDLFEMR